MNSTHWGELAALGTAVLWTFSTLAWTSAGRTIGALSVSFLRLVVASVLLLIYGRLTRGLWLPSDASAETWWALGLSGFVGFFMGDICLFKAFLLIGPRLTLLFQSLAPPMSAVLAGMFLGDTLAPKDWLAMIVTTAGVSWVVLERPEVNGQAVPSKHLVSGSILAVLAAAGQAVGLVLAKQGIGQYDAGAATFIRVLGALVGFVALVTFASRWPAVVRAARHRKSMATILVGALIGPLFGVILYMIAVRNCHAGVVATIVNTMPVLILPCVVILYHERVSPRAIAGAIISVIGVAILMH